jgi:hypothetical protein
MCPKVAISVQFAPRGANSTSLCHIGLDPWSQRRARAYDAYLGSALDHETKRGKFSSVAVKDFHVSLPQEVVGGFGWNESEVPIRIHEALVMDLLRLDRLSEAQAAGILGVARWELLELMGRYDVAAIRMSTEELDRELATEVKRNGAK